MVEIDLTSEGIATVLTASFLSRLVVEIDLTSEGIATDLFVQRHKVKRREAEGGRL